jgi:hypothetical protein
MWIGGFRRMIIAIRIFCFLGLASLVRTSVQSPLRNYPKRKLISKDGENIIVLATVDAQPESVPMLVHYVTHFNPMSKGLNGTPYEIKR